MVISWRNTCKINTKKPVVTYSAAGTYSVTLTSTNADGSSSIVKSNCVTIFQYNTFTDARDNKTYKSLKIGNDEWMIENLNFQTDSGSYIYTVFQIIQPYLEGCITGKQHKKLLQWDGIYK